MKRLCLSVFVSILLFSTLALAQSSNEEKKITVPESSLPKNVLDSIKQVQQLQEVKQKGEEYQKYFGFAKGLGKEVGVAMNEGLKAVENHADKIANTGVGKFIMFLIAYKVIGTDFIQFIVGVPLLFIGTFIFIWSYRKNCIPRSMLETVKREGKEAVKTYVIINEKKYDKDGNQRWAHIIMYFIWCIFCILVIFL